MYHTNLLTYLVRRMELLPEPYDFLDHIFNGLERLNITVDAYELDHICYRVSTRERYNYLKSELSRIHSLIAETMINGRPIANFELSAPLTYKKRKIHIIELPAPKPFSHYDEGYEHVEFVLDDSLEDFLGQCRGVELDLRGMKKARNRDVRIQLGEFSVKFHEQSLREIIEEERN